MKPRSLSEVLQEAKQLEQRRAAFIENVPDAVKQARLNAGWTQTQLASAIGKSVAYVSMVENKDRTPSTASVQAIFTALSKGGKGGTSKS